ncbi:MAG: class I SAM-dependent methyltransferase [Symbiobacteriia bacterium]
MIAQGYDRSAYLYDELVGPSYLAGVRGLLSRFPVPVGASILDVGTGTGIALMEAVRQARVPSLAIGVDISPNMVRQASAKAAAQGVPAQFITADAEHLPFLDRTFDVVICSSAFHWFSDRVRAAQEMYRVLKPGGRLLLQSAAAPCSWEWFAAMAAAAHAITGRGDLVDIPTLPPPMELITAVAAAGFHVVHVSTPTQHTQTDPAKLTAMMSLVVPHWNSKLDSATAMRVVELGNQFLSNRQADGAPYTWAAVEVVGFRTAP